MSYRIRRLNVGEFDLYKQVRLASLRDSPEAFCTSLASALTRDDASWIAQADGSAIGQDRATFIMLTDEPIGLATLYRDTSLPSEGELLQVWVAPSFRGGGAAVDLMNAVLDWATSNGFVTIRAEVTRPNLKALNFYKRYGFAFLPSQTNSATEPYILTKHCRPQ